MMARKSTPTVIQEGELQGFDLDEYVNGIVEGIHDAMGQADLRTAGCALDVAVSEFLMIAEHAEGRASSRHYANLFGQTIEPYTSPTALPSYQELRMIQASKKR
jgi:hypothetical protein